MLTVTNSCGSNIYKQQIKIDLTSTDDIVGNEFSLLLYPNPANTHINVEIKDQVTIINSIEVYNAIGQKIDNISKINSTNTYYNVEKLASGMYYFNIVTPKGNITRKFEVIR